MIRVFAIIIIAIASTLSASACVVRPSMFKLPEGAVALEVEFGFPELRDGDLYVHMTRTDVEGRPQAKLYMGYLVSKYAYEIPPSITFAWPGRSATVYATPMSADTYEVADNPCFGIAVFFPESVIIREF